MPLTNSHAAEIRAFADKLRRREIFSLVRFGEGEEKCVRGWSRDLRNKGAGEFNYQAADPKYVRPRQRLIASLQYRHPDYYVGLICPCCSKPQFCERLRKLANQAANHTTWASLWSNHNHPYFLANLPAIFATYRCCAVVHQQARLDRLPFSVAADVRAPVDAWLYCDEMLEQLRPIAADPEHWLFLMCSGPASNILIAELHSRFPQHTYLDVGSALDPMLFEGAAGMTRDFLAGDEYALSKVCRWF